MSTCSALLRAAVGGKPRGRAVRRHRASCPRAVASSIHVAALDPDWVNPWQTRTAARSTGSGVFVERRGDRCLILTAAHVVANSTFLQVQLAGQPEKALAEVVAVAHETDLALISVDAGLFEGVQPLCVAPADELPQLRDKVYVLGFPVGGDDLSITDGVVSRVEVQSYSHSHARALAVTVDAAVNSGNSGGPVMSERSGKVIGIAFQGYAGSDIEAQGHMVPAPLIQRFLAAAAAGRPTGLPSLGFYLQQLQAPPLRRKLQLRSGDGGVLVSGVEHGGCCDGLLREGDVVLAVDGERVASDGTCMLLGRRLSLTAAVHRRCFGDVMPLEVLRDGQALTLQVTLAPSGGLVPRGQYDLSPPYFLLAGLLFQPLSLEYLSTWGELKDAPPHLLQLHFDGVRLPSRTEVVLLTQVLADEATLGYSGDTHGMDVVVALNGQPVVCLRSFVERLAGLMRAPDTPFIELETRRGDLRCWVVLDAARAAEATERVLKRYQIPAAASAEFLDLVQLGP